MEEKQEKTKSHARRVIRSTISVLATILLIAVIVFAYNFYRLSPSRIFRHHFHAYDLPAETDTAGIAAKHFLEGSRLLKNNDAEKAITEFQSVLDQNKKQKVSRWNDEAEYYLALAYIKDKDYDLALPLLRKIRDDKQHLYHKQVSARLIRQVKMLKWR
jgi:tetratricopeptide (TPR) repeat protein